MPDVNQGEKEDFDEQVIEDNSKKLDFNVGFDDDVTAGFT